MEHYDRIVLRAGGSWPKFHELFIQRFERETLLGKPRALKP